MGTNRPNKAAKKNSAARSRAPAPELDDDLDDDLDVEAADASAADLDAVFAELGGNSNATITVTRVGTNGREERCDRFMASELVGNFDVIRDRWGAGTYWLYGHDGKTLARKRPITFARSVDEQQRAAEPGAARASAPADLFTAAIDRLATLQREQFQQMLQLVNGRQQGAGLAEVITLAEKMQSMGVSRGGGSSDVETLLRGFDLARKFGAGGEEVSIGGALAEFVRAIREPPLLPAPGAPAASGGGGDHMQAMIQRALAQQLPALLRGAQSETAPGVYAQLLFDQVPEIYLRPMIEYLKRPDWFDLLARADGRVVPFKGWFEALGSEIVQATLPEEPPPP